MIDSLQALDLPAGTVAALSVVVLALVAYDAIAGVRDHGRFTAAITAAPPEDIERVRTHFLLRWAWQPWVLTLIALGVVLAAPGVGLSALGLRWPDGALLASWFDSSLGRGGLLGAVIGLLVVGVGFGILTHRRRAEGEAPPPNAAVNRNVEPMLPTGRSDRRAWLALSVTAGVTEEVMYRGLVLLVLAQLLPGAPEPVIWGAAAVAFGLAHTYQRLTGIVVTGVLGLIFIALYVGTGSLLPGMVLHTALDARAALIKAR